jgi:hypothetical protein
MDDNTVRAELVEALPSPLQQKNREAFDRLRPNGAGIPIASGA